MNHFIADLSVDEKNWLFNALADWWELNEQLYPDADNVRLACLQDVGTLNAFQLTEDAGCCQQYEMVLGPSPHTGRSYRYSFNYGHICQSGIT